MGGTEEPGTGAAESSSEETPLMKRPWVWVVFVAVVIVLPASAFLVVRCRRRQKRIPKKVNEIPMHPLLPRGEI